MKILAFAYACEPQQGSEPGAGWGWARLLARLGHTWVITRENNREVIEAGLPSIPEAEFLHFVYVDLSERARSWKRGQRGIRLYYMLWQRAALKRARELHAEEGFDLVWHLTLANVWMGSLAARVGPPFVYGPVGGVVRPPWRLAPMLGIRGIFYELLRAGGQLTGRYANPLARIAWRKAQVIFVQNPDTREWLPRRYRGKAVVFPNALVSEIGGGARKQRITRPPTALYAGRLLPLKGIALAIRAIAATDEWRLVVAGAGYDEPRLRRLAGRMHVSHRVEFIGWLARDKVLGAMQEDADVFIFPSMHDEAPLAVLEALACGLPVVCLDHGGAFTLAGSSGTAVPTTGGSRAVVARLAESLSRGIFPPEKSARERSNQFRFEYVSDRLRSVLLGHGVLSAADLVPSSADSGTSNRRQRVEPADE